MAFIFLQIKRYTVFIQICAGGWGWGGGGGWGGALQFIAAKMIVLIESKFGPKIIYFDGLNSILHVF